MPPRARLSGRHTVAPVARLGDDGTIRRHSPLQRAEDPFLVIEITCEPLPPRYKTVTMCLAIPGRVEEIDSGEGLRIGRVNFGGVVKRVCLDFTPEIKVGTYVIVHAGFAISEIDEESAQKTLADFHSMGLLDEELANEEEVFRRAASAPSSPCPDGSCGTP